MIAPVPQWFRAIDTGWMDSRARDGFLRADHPPLRLDRDRGHMHGVTRSKLTRAQVREIRARLATESQISLAVAFSVSQATICNIATGKSWKGIM